MNDIDLRPRTRFSRGAALIPTTAAVILATVALGAFDRTGPATSDASPAPSVSQPAAGATRWDAGRAAAVRRHGDRDTRRHGGGAGVRRTVAGTADPARPDGPGEVRTPAGPLTVADAGRVLDPEVAGLYYWPPSGDIGIVYDDLGQTVPPPGMVQLGTVTSGLPTIASAGNRFTVSIERA